MSDILTGRILQIAAHGVRLHPPRLVAKGLQGPEAMALTGDGRLLVIEAWVDRLSIVDLATGQTIGLISGLNTMSDQSSSMSSRYATKVCCVNPPGIVYVIADDGSILCHIALPSK